MGLGVGCWMELARPLHHGCVPATEGRHHTKPQTTRWRQNLDHPLKSGNSGKNSGQTQDLLKSVYSLEAKVRATGLK